MKGEQNKMDEMTKNIIAIYEKLSFKDKKQVYDFICYISASEQPGPDAVDPGPDASRS